MTWFRKESDGFKQPPDSPFPERWGLCAQQDVRRGRLGKLRACYPSELTRGSGCAWLPRAASFRGCPWAVGAGSCLNSPLGQASLKKCILQKPLVPFSTHICVLPGLLEVMCPDARGVELSSWGNAPHVAAASEASWQRPGPRLFPGQPGSQTRHRWVPEHESEGIGELTWAYPWRGT